MTKADLIDIIAKDAKINKKEASEVVSSLLEGITTSVKKDGKLTLTGFGTFSKVKRKARKGVNPQTGEQIQIKAQTSVKFTAGKTLKNAV